jgi:hypothetical protein
MSTIRIWSVGEWFRCIGPSTTPRERRAALAHLIRMLTGDANRPRSPISLPGRPVNPAPPTLPLAPDEQPSSGSKWGRLPIPAARGEPTAEDAEWTYTRDALERMNRRFAERLERAIASGQEHQPAPPRADSNSKGRPQTPAAPGASGSSRQGRS